MNGNANLYKRLKRRESQKLFLAQARDMARKARDPLTEAAALQALAGIEGEEGDKSRAVAMAEEALGLLPQDCAERANGLVELAMRHWGVGDFDAAIRNAEAAAEEAQRASQPRMQALALMLAAVTRLPQQEADTALLAPQGGPRPGPEAAAAKVDPQVAIARLTEAAAVAESLDDWQLTWLAHYFRGKAYAVLGDDQRKLEGFLEAAKAIGRQRELGWTPTEREWFAERPVRLYRLIALEYLRQGKTSEAFPYAELGKAQIMLESMSARPLSMTATRWSPELDQRQQGALKRLGELDLMLRRERSRPEGERDEELIKELRGKRERTEDELRQVKRELQRENPGYADLNYPQPAALDTARAQLAPSTVLVEYVVESESAAAVVISRERHSAVILQTTGKELSRQIDELHEAIGALSRSGASAAAASAEEQLSELAHQLYQTLVEPIRPQFPPKADRLVIVPDGPLHLAPFAALLVRPGSEDGEPPRYLCEDYCLSYVPSVTVLLELGSRKPAASTRSADRDRILAVCDPAYPEPNAEQTAKIEGELALRSAASWSRLAASAHEGEGIRSVWGNRATLLDGAQATEERVKSVARNAVCLHFATHAYLDSSSPLYSAIVLAPGGDPQSQDGFLQAYEVCEMNLEGSLSVLSACETARGRQQEGEGLMGLSRSFFLAGATAVVATLWQVDDEATSVLGTELHRHLREGKPIGEALREAQLTMLRGYDRASGQLRGPGKTRPREPVPLPRPKPTEPARGQRLSPFYWAAFGVYGDPAASLAAEDG